MTYFAKHDHSRAYFRPIWGIGKMINDKIRSSRKHPKIDSNLCRKTAIKKLSVF